MSANPRRYTRFETPALGDDAAERRPSPLQPIVPAGIEPTEPQPTHDARDPVVRVIREDGRIRSIEIDCTCGRPLRIECEYEPEPPASPSAKAEAAPTAGAPKRTDPKAGGTKKNDQEES